MSTDRELLEWAAKAAGKYAPREDCPNGWEGIKPETWGCFRMSGEGRVPEYQWNPLVNDGDALRLLVALKLELEIDKWGAVVVMETGYCDEDAKGDHYSATRRAIVRAAAEIGKAKK